MKFDADGNLIWEKNLNFDETINQASEIESFNDQLVITGQIATDDTKTIIAKLDTTAKVLEKHISTPFASNGTIDVEIYNHQLSLRPYKYWVILLLRTFEPLGNFSPALRSNAAA